MVESTKEDLFRNIRRAKEHHAALPADERARLEAEICPLHSDEPSDLERYMKCVELSYIFRF